MRRRRGVEELVGRSPHHADVVGGGNVVRGRVGRADAGGGRRVGADGG